MRVLQINSVCGVGSTGRIATDIHSILEEQGHESWIAYGRGEAKNCKNAIKIGNNIDNYKHVIKTRILDRHGFASEKATKLFIEKVRELDPDVIHLHNIHGYYINIEILFRYLKEADKKVIWTLHDCWAFTGHCSHFDYIDCGKWKTGCYDCPQKNNYPSSIILDNSGKNYHEKKDLFNGVKNMTIVTPSKWLSKLVNQSFLSGYPVQVINNGIDLNIFKPLESEFREKYKLERQLIILGIANVWEKRKGLHYFLELAKRIKENESIVLVGLTEEQIKDLPANVIGINKTDNTQELAEIYSAANIFINPTLEDNFPTTNLEALACGTPVITFNTGGSPESIDSTCGVTIEKGRIEDLIAAIEQLRITNFSSNNCIVKAKNFDKYDRYNDYINQYLRGL